MFELTENEKVINLVCERRQLWDLKCLTGHPHAFKQWVPGKTQSLLQISSPTSKTTVLFMLHLGYVNPLTNNKMQFN
jgi:hypothetical protein